jgi:two-component system, NarL family, response regulator DegU
MTNLLSPVQVALLDDHPLFRQGLRYILQTMPFVETVVEAGELTELQAQCRQRLPDVLLLDLQMPGVDGPEAAQRLLAEFPDLKIIVLSMFSADKFISQMFKLGARSYLPKDADQTQLREALENVLTKGYHFDERISRALMRGVQHPVRQASLTLSDTVALTRREQEVLALICAGCTTAEIADKLFLSRRTVEGHRQNLLDKTETANSTALVVYAVRRGLFVA